MLSLFRKLWLAYANSFKKRLDKNYFKILMKEAKKHDPSAFYHLGRLYEEGSTCVEKNKAFAYAFYKLAYEMGVTEAQQAIKKLEFFMAPEEWEKAQECLKKYHEKRTIN